MEINARDINEKRFHDAWRGYDQEEVDDFLDQVAETVQRLQENNEHLRGRLEELDHAVSTSRDTEEMLKKTLVTAQQAAEEAIASAKAKAEALISEAEERAERANVEATDRVSTAEAEARRRTLQADREYTTKTRNLEATVERLRKFESELRERMHAFLEQQMHSLQTMGDATPPSGRHVISPDQGDEDVAGRRSPHEGSPHDVATDDAPDASMEPLGEESQDVPEAGALELSGPEHGEMSAELGEMSAEHGEMPQEREMSEEHRGISEEHGEMSEENDGVEELDDVAELVAEESEDMTYRLDALGEAEEGDAGEDPLDERNPEDSDEEPRALDAVDDEADNGLWAEGAEALEVTDTAPLVTENVVRLEDEDGHEAPRRGRRKRARQKVGRRGPRFWKDED